MIELNKSDMIGKGWHRECFIHPEDDKLCLKVVVSGNDQETKREQSYYQLLKKRNVTWDKLPKFHGNIETNFGSGAIFDLIRDENGDVAKTVEFYLNDESLMQEMHQHIHTALIDLKDYLIDQNIITMSIKPKNLLYQKQCGLQGSIYIVDNIGNSDLFPISSYSRYFGHKKLDRKWKKFQSLLIKSYPQSPLIINIAQTI
mgnify:CR=1 FL=1